MALKDSIKHFRDVDNYNTYVEKKDIDDNLDLLADNIDTKADKTIVGIITDGTTLKQQNEENKLVIGTDCEASGDYSFAYGNTCKASGDYSLAFGEECEASENKSFALGKECKASHSYSFALGYRCEASESKAFAYGNTCKATAEFSEAWGYECEASGNYSYARGYQVKTSGLYSQAFGANIENKQALSIAYGVGRDGIANQNLRHFIVLKTDDDTQTDFDFPIALWIKSLNYIIIRAEILQDDYSTKWIFERKLIVRVDADGNVTIDDDSNTDIVKDDTDWKFDISSTDDSENPTLTLKATGKADTNIAWGIEVENRQTYFVG